MAVSLIIVKHMFYVSLFPGLYIERKLMARGWKLGVCARGGLVNRVERLRYHSVY
jgi:hypothetical protein